MRKEEFEYFVLKKFFAFWKSKFVEKNNEETKCLFSGFSELRFDGGIEWRRCVPGGYARTDGQHCAKCHFEEKLHSISRLALRQSNQHFNFPGEIHEFPWPDLRSRRRVAKQQRSIRAYTNVLPDPVALHSNCTWMVKIECTGMESNGRK